MNVIADICVIPMGVGVSVSEYVAACERILKEAGLNPQLHAYGTNVEGPWDTVMAALKQCHETVHEMGAPRISTTMRLGTHIDREESIAAKIKSVREKLA
ncbi:MTH1187 family thiamine-binding protein [Planctomycetota bacterium]